MTKKTKAETVFEEFCNSNKIKWEKLIESKNPAPDYKVLFNNEFVYIEVKQIDKDDNFKPDFGSRTIVSHIREKIKESRRQLKAVSSQGAPAILLVYNNLDGLQMFGTGQHDFITAMYGDMTLMFDKNEHKFTDFFMIGIAPSAKTRARTSAPSDFCIRPKKAPELHSTRIFTPRISLIFQSRVPACIEVIRIELDKSRHNNGIEADRV